MSNSYNISVHPEIAAVAAQVTVVDNVVDAIRATDVVNIQTNISGNETKIDTLDLVADAIKLKTDLLPLTEINLAPMRPYIGHVSFSDVAYATKVDITGAGYLHQVNVQCTTAPDVQARLKVTIDGVLIEWNESVGYTAYVKQSLAIRSAVTGMTGGGIPPVYAAEDANKAFSQGCNLIRFDTSLLIEVMMSGGAGTGTLFWHYSLTA